MCPILKRRCFAEASLNRVELVIVFIVFRTEKKAFHRLLQATGAVNLDSVIVIQSNYVDKYFGHLSVGFLAEREK